MDANHTARVEHHTDASGLWCTCGERWPCTQRQVSAIADIIAKANAGAALVYALYHSGAELMKALPPAVVNAYAAACRIYQVPRGGGGEIGRDR